MNPFSVCYWYSTTEHMATKKKSKSKE
jgi:hypothetical protein